MALDDIEEEFIQQHAPGRYLRGALELALEQEDNSPLQRAALLVAGKTLENGDGDLQPLKEKLDVAMQAAIEGDFSAFRDTVKGLAEDPRLLAGCRDTQILQICSA